MTSTSRVARRRRGSSSRRSGGPPLLEELPGAEEAIRYGIPTLRLDGKNVIHFAAFAKHVSVYPAPRGVPELEEELAGYGGGKGTLQMPVNRPLPLDLVRRIARYRLREHREQASHRRGKSPSAL